MSKKKTCGSTMTLKDFHGGSIPSDLPLPSAPGVTVRPTERLNFDKPSAWGAAMGRLDYRGRPKSSSSISAFDDRSPFMATPAHIGRNFDEDERKPIDGSSVTRRTVSDEALGVRVELKPSVVASGRLYGTGKPGSGVTPALQVHGSQKNSYSSRVADRGQVEVNSLGFSSQSGSHTNVWAARKEAAVVAEARPSVWSEEVAASKLAHASALDKVSSGRWQTKLLVQQPTDVEVIQHPRRDKNYLGDGTHAARVGDSIDTVLARHTERGLTVAENGQKEFHTYVKESAALQKPNLSNYTKYGDGVQLPNRQSAAADLHLSSGASERPKLNLLPRSKPLESAQPPVPDNKQVHQQPISSSHVGIASDAHEKTLPIKPGSGSSDSESRTVERPKLNIRPRSQPAQQLQVTTEKERNALFGGARPRELVLKERGIDTESTDLIQSPNKMKNETFKSEGPQENLPNRHIEKADNQSLDPRVGRKFERKDTRTDDDRAPNPTNWRSDGRKNNNVEGDKQQPERQPSPETWRKPSPEPSATGVRHGKAASAVELAQAFSRSMSDPKTSEKMSTQRSFPNLSTRNPVPFSRLTVRDSRPHINGY